MNVEAEASWLVQHGFQPVPLHPRSKKPVYRQWETTSYTVGDLADFAGDRNLGVRLGVNGLVEVDLDEPYALAAGALYLPDTPAKSGRAGAPDSHWWYRVAEPPGTTRWRTSKDPVGVTLVELRGTGGQTVVPPSVHPSGEVYEWTGRGNLSQLEVVDLVGPDGLLTVVRTVALAARLAQRWPGKGGRHDAFLALAGALMNNSDQLDDWWTENRTALFVTVLAKITDDEEWRSRAKETVLTTARRLRDGYTTQGWPTLAEVVGDDVVKDVRRWERDLRPAAGASVRRSGEDWSTTVFETVTEQVEDDGEKPSTWAPVDLRALSAAGYVRPTPTLGLRSDGKGLFYPGRLNMLVGPSRSGKTWLAMHAALQACTLGETVVYIDMEDSAEGFLTRMTDVGLTVDDVPGLSYVAPAEPIAPLQFNRWGRADPTDDGLVALMDFRKLIKRSCPSLVVIDGLTVLMTQHGLNPNDASGVEHVGHWLRSMTAEGSRPAVLVLDHNGKNPRRGGEPHGSQHKTAMVSGSLLQTWEVSQIKPGALGRAEVLVIKDRPGGVLQVSEVEDGGDNDRVTVAARLTVDSTWTSSELTLVDVTTPGEDWGDVPALSTLDLSGMKVPDEPTKSEKASGAVGPGVLEQAVLSALSVYGVSTFPVLVGLVERDPKVATTTADELNTALRTLTIGGQVITSKDEHGSTSWYLNPGA